MKFATRKVLSFLVSSLVAAVPVIAFALVFALPALAFAADGQTALQNLTDQIMAVLAPVLVTAVGLVATAILMKLKAKLHLDIADKTMESWSALAGNAAMRAAEWARQKAKTLEGDKKLPGGDVMEVAVNWALQMAEQQKLPQLAREKLVGLIEAELFKLRLAYSSMTSDTTPPEAVAKV